MNQYEFGTEVTLILEPSSNDGDNGKEEEDDVKTELIAIIGLTGEQIGEMFQNPTAYTNNDATDSTNNSNTASCVRVGAKRLKQCLSS